MDYVPGQCLTDCWDKMGVLQKTTMAKDLARMMAEMFVLTASHCDVLRDRSLNDSQCSLHYKPSTVDAPTKAHTEIVDDDFLIGPINDVTFLTLTEIVPVSLCGAIHY